MLTTCCAKSIVAEVVRWDVSARGRAPLQRIGSTHHRQGDEMLPYGKVQALQEARVAKFVAEQERVMPRKVRKDRSAGLPELLNSLAQGLAAIGIPRGPGNRRPAAPAY